MAKRKASKITLDGLLKGSIQYDNVLVRPLADDKLSVGDSEIIRPQNYEDKSEFGTVLMVGEGRIFDNGVIVPLRVKVGDTVYFQKYSSQKLRVEGEDLLIIREEDIYWHDN
jgi:chaperonin GroES